MTVTSAQLLDQIRVAHRTDIDLTLRRSYTDLLAALGNPQDHLPPVIHVAGTNGKGSTCAFLRAIAEACGKTVHVYTSPHLVTFHERIRVAGKLIGEDALVALLQEIIQKSPEGAISVFEAGTAAALAAFARTPADLTLLEVGLGGRLDATNVVDEPLADVIARLSFDHRDYLGDTMDKIAREKAGILRRRVPCFTAPQPSAEAMLALRDESTRMDVPLIVGGEDWRIEVVDENHFRFIGPDRKIENLPRPALVGTHQLWNAGLAIATSATFPFPVPDEAIRTAMQTVCWAGRLQKITEGPLLSLLPKGCELWLDGGHNDSAGEVLAAQLRRWQAKDNHPVALVYAMLSSKKPEEFLQPMLPFIGSVRTVFVQGEVAGIDPELLAQTVRQMGVPDAASAASIREALTSLAKQNPSRILVCGSLYLVGKTLQTNTES